MWKRLSFIAAAALGLAACDRPTIPPDPGEPALNAVQASGPVLEVKFAEELQVRPDGGRRLRSERGRSLEALQAVLDRHAAREVRPLIQAGAPHLPALRAAARATSAEPVPDLASWHHVVLPPGADAQAALAELRARPEVLHAYAAPRPAPPPVSPDFSGQQTYFGAAPQGSEAVYARSLPGGRGAGVTVVDLEYDWHLTHEDLGFSTAILITGDRYTQFGRNHGTAVLGQLAGRDNGFGVTGGVPDATFRVASPIYGGNYRPADAITASAGQMVAGDVLLLEQQTDGPNGQLVPLEYIPSVYDAVRLATQKGIVVVEAAGNGGQNLDDPMFGGRFNRSQQNSGAIIVGAGNASHARLSFSCFGSRLDLQGLGEGVTTTGYGNLFGGPEDTWYTHSFGGTSSASPIVAAAAATIQGYHKSRGQPVRTPAQMLTLLTSTGTPQTGNTAERIGPYPNLRAAITSINAGPLTVSVSGPGTLNTAGTYSWSANHTGGVAPYTYTWQIEWMATGTRYALQPIKTQSFYVDGTRGSFILYATVRSADGQTVTATKWVQNLIPGSCGRFC